MTKLEGLHTLIRKYCMAAFAFWTKEYAEKRSGSNFPEYTYSDSDYNLFPRYNAIEAILKGVETIVPGDYTDFEVLKKDIMEAGLQHQTSFTNNPDNDIEEHAIQEEREKFKVYVESITGSDINGIEPLPLRRKFKSEEKNAVRQMLKAKWGYDGDYWEPFLKKSPQETLFLQTKYITDADSLFIKELLTEKGIKNLFEIEEAGDDYETDLESFASNCFWEETIYCDETYTWVIYGSHEDTVTFGGDWLINSIKEQFKERSEELNSWN